MSRPIKSIESVTRKSELRECEAPEEGASIRFGRVIFGASNLLPDDQMDQTKYPHSTLQIPRGGYGALPPISYPPTLLSGLSGHLVKGWVFKDLGNLIDSGDRILIWFPVS